MVRFLLVLLISLTFLPPAIAIVTPRHELSSLFERNYRSSEKRLPVPSPDDAYRITEKTEVLLDGRKCPYEKVPYSAKIIFMEIDSEASKVILRIHFQSRK
jgi:hypothetical protein